MYDILVYRSERKGVIEMTIVERLKCMRELISDRDLNEATKLKLLDEHTKTLQVQISK